MLHRYPTVTPHSYIMALQDAYYWLSLRMHDLIPLSNILRFGMLQRAYLQCWDDVNKH